MPYRIDTYTDENVFSNTFGDTYTQTVWDSSCGEYSGTAFFEATYTTPRYCEWYIGFFDTDIRSYYNIRCYIDGVEIEASSDGYFHIMGDGNTHSIAMTSDSGTTSLWIVFVPIDHNEAIYFDVTRGALTDDNDTFEFLRYSENWQNCITSMRNLYFDSGGRCLFEDQKEMTYFGDVDLWRFSEKADFLFFWCSKLEYCDMTNAQTGKATDVAMMFYQCSSLKTLILEGWKFDNVTTFYMTFYGCSSLTSITGDFSGISADVSFEYSPLDLDSARRVINALSKVTKSRTLTLSQTTYDSLEDSDFENATEKGWTVARYK